MHAEPDADVTLTLPETTDCDADDAVCTASDKPLSRSVTITIPGPAPEPDAADLAPSGLAAEVVEGGVSLTWDAPAEDAESVTGYELSRQWTHPDEDNIVRDDLLTPDGAATVWVDTSFPETGVTYAYRVRAVRDGETSGWSNEAQVEVPEDAESEDGTVAPPDDPVALPQHHVKPSRLDWAYAVAGDHAVHLEWAGPSPGTAEVTGYRILVTRDGGQTTSVLVADTGNTDTTYTDAPLNAGLTRHYVVKAVNSAGISRGVEYVLSIATTLTDTEVPADWGLIPAGHGPGDSFRLLFLSSGTRDATDLDIGVYNTWIQDQAAAGHKDIQDYSSLFRVVGSAVVVHAIDNTGTNFLPSARGVPIYWLGGNRVAREYADFYDGSWEDEANPKNGSGADRPVASDAEQPWTGSDHNGRKDGGHLLVLQRRFKEECPGMYEGRLGAWHGSVWPVRCILASPPATAAAHSARTVPGAAFPAPPGRLGAG